MTKRFLEAGALAGTIAAYEVMKLGAEQRIASLDAVADLAPEVLATTGLDSRFISNTSALPRNPTPTELGAVPQGQVLGGAYRPAGQLQRLVWTSSSWQNSGKALVDQGLIEVLTETGGVPSRLAGGIAPALSTGAAVVQVSEGGPQTQTLALAAGQHLTGNGRGDGQIDTLTFRPGVPVGVRLNRNNRAEGLHLVGPGTGKGVDLTDAYWGGLKSISVEGWAAGIYAERSLYLEAEQIEARGNLDGLVFHAAPGNFNVDWFNNVQHLNLVNAISNTRYALDYEGQGLSIGSLDVTGSGSQAGTDGVRAAIRVRSRSYDLNLPNVYAEALAPGTNVLYAEGGVTHFGGWFQGGGSGPAARAGAVIKATGGTVIVHTVTGQDYWERLVDADGPNTTVVLMPGSLRAQHVYEIERIRATNGAKIVDLSDGMGSGGPLANNRGLWAANTNYLQGDLYTYQQQLYTANANHNSGATWNAANSTLSVARGADGPTGLNRVATATAYTKGNVYYRESSALGFKVLQPSDQQRGLTLVTICDRNGDLCPVGSVVDVDGLGYVADTDYYVIKPGVDGKNFAPISGTPAAPSSTAAYFYIGRTFDLGAGKGVQLQFNFAAAVLPGATAVNPKWTQFDDLTYNVQPTTSQILRPIDTETGGLTDYKLLAEGDAAVLGTGWAVSPVQRTIGGTTKGVFVQDRGYSGSHVRTPADWVDQADGDYLLTVALADAGQLGFGFIWGMSSTAAYAARFYGNASGINYLVLQTAAISAGTPTFTDIAGQGAGTSGTAAPATKVYVNIRVNIKGATVKVKVWAYDTTKTLANQAQSEPGTWTRTYTAGGNFPVGKAGWVFSTTYYRIVMATQSPDGDTPALFRAGS